MKVHAPIRGFIKANAPHGSISQYFGENPELYSSMCHEVDGVRTCMIGHNGVDIVAPWYTDVLAVEGGIVSDVKDSPDGYGKHVRVNSPDVESGGREWTYGHLADFAPGIRVGSRVSAGQVIGHMGNTGFVVSSQDGNGFWKQGSNKYAGTHLHLGCRRYDSRGTVTDYRNGYFGSIDFLDMLPDDGVSLVEQDRERVGILMRQVVWALGKIGFKIDLSR